MKTKSFFEKFKGKYPTFSVWEVDDSGNKVGDFPLFSMGTRKAVALANHLEDFKDFVQLVKNSEVKLEV